MSKSNTAAKESGESGSTIIGIISSILAVIFLYTGLQRVWWTYILNVPNYLLYGLTYLLIASIAIGGAGYGLLSKKAGSRALIAISSLFGTFSFAGAAYFWFIGMVLDGTEQDVFYALLLSLGGITLLAIAGITSRIAERRGLTSSQEDQKEAAEQFEERIEQRGEELEERIEERGEELDAQIRRLPVRIAAVAPWSKLVALGVVLWIASFPLLEYESLFAVIVFTAWFTVPIAIYFDSVTVREQIERRTWWWVFALVSAIPFAAILGGIAWLLWRRRFM